MAAPDVSAHRYGDDGRAVSGPPASSLGVVPYGGADGLGGLDTLRSAVSAKRRRGFDQGGEAVERGIVGRLK